MRRAFLVLTTFAGLSAWADAQTGPRLAADHARLWHANHGLLEELLAHGVRLSDADGKLDQAAECRRAVGTLGQALAAAADDPAADPDRVAELADELAEFITGGLTPTLTAARSQVRAGSPGAERLKDIEAATAAELAGCRQAVPADGRVGRVEWVKRARANLAAAADGVGAK